jgi:putative DNA modification/repair radical SAM protein
VDLKRKLEILADAAKYDASCASSGSKRNRMDGGIGNTEGMGICHSYTPDGRCVSLLKILLTNYCIYDCKFCINRNSSDTPRARFTPEEVAELTIEFYKRNYIEGLFLSSGVIQSSDFTMSELTRAAKILRTEYRFGGYIHLKAVAGASPDIIKEAGRWADRLSANIELPSQKELDELAPGKRHEEIETSMDSIKANIDEAKDNQKFKSLKKVKPPPFAPAGQTTQMIVGATPSTDQSILHKADGLYKGFRLRRVYYSAFSPIPDGDSLLPFIAPPLIREHRLYQADWLMRFYGFKAEEIVSNERPNLELTRDPKTSWALLNREFFPVDVNLAPREALLRIPGVGVRNVERILEIRRYRSLTLLDLGKLRIAMSRAKYFIKTKDHNPSLKLIDGTSLESKINPEKSQLSLFGILPEVGAEKV